MSANDHCKNCGACLCEHCIRHYCDTEGHRIGCPVLSRERLTEVVMGEWYVHRANGNAYFVLAIGRLVSNYTSEQVVYYSNIDPQVWIRPLAEFKEKFCKR